MRGGPVVTAVMTIVSPYCTKQLPAACLASRPVSMEKTLAPMVFSTRTFKFSFLHYKGQYGCFLFRCEAMPACPNSGSRHSRYSGRAGQKAASVVMARKAERMRELAPTPDVGMGMPLRVLPTQPSCIAVRHDKTTCESRAGG